MNKMILYTLFYFLNSVYINLKILKTAKLLKKERLIYDIKPLKNEIVVIIP